MRLPPSKSVLVAVLLALLPSPALAGTNSGATVVYDSPLRVCAAPDDLPYSNRAEQGFENKLAAMVASDLGTAVVYTWFPQRSGFLRETLGADECDVVMGLPDIDGIEPTRSYYRSGYVFVSRADRNLTFSSMNDPALKRLRIGVTLVGADGAGTPPAVALGREGIIDGVKGYPVYGDGSDSARLADPIRAVENNAVDLAAVWGPIAGYYAQTSAVPLRVTPITDTNAYLPQLFEYPISMAVRPGDDDLRDRLNAVLRRRAGDITALLESYGIPLL
jgi:mxaJ protein